MSRVIAAVLAAWLTAGQAAADPSPAPRPADELYRLDYRFGVALECGLVDDRVLAGYYCASQAAIARRGFGEAARRATLSRAMIAVEREWSNRGLGGYRGWCRTEGEDAARAFRAACQAEDQSP